MSDHASPFVLGPAEPGDGKASTSFKVRADDTAGLFSVFEFTLAAWESGPVLHLHKASDESFYVLSGELELQIGGFLSPRCSPCGWPTAFRTHLSDHRVSPASA